MFFRRKKLVFVTCKTSECADKICRELRRLKRRDIHFIVLSESIKVEEVK